LDGSVVSRAAGNGSPRLGGLLDVAEDVGAAGDGKPRRLSVGIRGTAPENVQREDEEANPRAEHPRERIK
jgi:hypothetical protein